MLPNYDKVSGLGLRVRVLGVWGFGLWVFRASEHGGSGFGAFGCLGRLGLTLTPNNLPF